MSPRSSSTRVQIRNIVALAALLLLPTFASAGEPYGTHLSIAPDGLAVAWFEKATLGGDARVEYGATASLGESEPARLVARVPDSVIVYAATLRGIAPDATFHYRVTSPGGTSAVFTAKAPPGPDAPLHVISLGDHGHEQPASAATVRALVNASPDVVVIAGDLSYADGRSKGWDDWFRLIEPIASTRPLMVAVGNHEREDVPLPPTYDSLLYEQYSGRFVMPGDEYHFSWRAGPVAFVTVNSEDACLTSTVTASLPYIQAGECKDERANESLITRLETLLKEATATNPRWLVVYHHRPVYSHGGYEGNPVIASRWTPLYEKYGVDLVLSGHDHVYIRTFPLIGGVATTTGAGPFPETAPIYIVSGGGGDSVYRITEPAPAWSAVANATLNHVSIRADAERLAVEARDLTTGRVLDAFLIGAPLPAAAVDGAPAPASTPGIAAGLVAIAGFAVALAARRLR